MLKSYDMIAPTAPRRSRQSLALLAGTTCILLLGIWLFSDSLSDIPVRYAHRAQEYLESGSSYSTSYSQPQSERIHDCLDPYRQPGYFHIDSEDYRRSQWIPYDPDFLDSPDPEAARYPREADSGDLFFDDAPPPLDFVEASSAPKQWMRLAVDEAQRRSKAIEATVPRQEQNSTVFVDMKQDEDWGWLWGRRLLMLGDSVDRFLIDFFCQEFSRSSRKGSLGRRTYAYCHIPEFNLTLTQWHFSGSWTYRPDWWWMNDMPVVAMEERWEQYYRPSIQEHVAGHDGRSPDLILWQNGLWDQRALWEAGEAHFGKGSENQTDYVMGFRGRKLVFQEVRFIAARVKKLVNMLTETFPNTPAMFRSITMHRVSDANDANLYEIDRIGRAVAANAGHETFEWGRIISADSWLYKDQVHPGKGPADWLFGTMALEYLARIAGAGGAPYFDGWDRCHYANSGWGGR